MNADVALYTGKTHAVCQDYATCFNGDPDRPFAIISDGCSGSPDTDFGARLLAAATRQSLRGSFDNKVESIRCLAYQALANANAIGLPNESLDATLGYVATKKSEFNGEDHFIAQLFGDGFIAVGFKGPERLIRIYEVNYPSGYPFYLNYVTNHRRIEQWIGESNDPAKGVVNCFDIALKDKVVGKVIGQSHSLGRTLKYFEVETFWVQEPIRDIEWVAVMSDGISSFVKKDETETSKQFRTISPAEVLFEMLAFKNFNGEFVQRRMKRFMADNEKRGWIHNDDVSIGAVYFGDYQ